jgi:glycosyltransferase involved in cell wall biosynthesis
LTTTPEYSAYLRVRDAVVAMKHAAPSDAARPSAYWSEELENIDYLADASPLIVRKLRHHAFHITGIRPYDYRNKDDGRREHFEARLNALCELGGEALLVPESPALGGFGYDIGGRLFNVDTLKFYEVLIGMERAGILGRIRSIDRPVVAEIGAGWGGFAYQFKTLSPRTTYVIIDLPELFLFSATYLGSVFPNARLAFVTTEQELTASRDADFIFLPHTLSASASSLPLDLVVNMVSFQEMTDAQVRRYAAMSAAARCETIYSFNRDRSPYNTELTSVAAALKDHYDVEEVRLLDTDYTSAMKKPPKPGRVAERSELGYRHLHGRLRHRAGGPAAGSNGAPRVALGMTLYNKAEHLPEAIESLLAQTYGDFRLILLDDASSDGTERIAREYEQRDPRVRYFRHATRQAMIATWREVVHLAQRECPSADYFAWVSDHDRWDPRWLEEMLDQFEQHPATVLAYPITQRMTPDGIFVDKGPRLFDTAGVADRRARWRRFCDEGVGSGDMVYGLMRMDALRDAGVFRTVLRPDRLLVAELTLHGEIRQVPKPLWFRRMFEETSIARQRQTLVPDGTASRLFGWPPWAQHAVTIYEVYVRPGGRPFGLDPGAWLAMIAQYLFTYGWRHFRKSETSHWFAKAVSRTLFAKKLAKHYVHHAVFHVLVARRIAWGRARRAGRRAVYEALMLTHRLGIRGGGGTPQG